MNAFDQMRDAINAAKEVNRAAEVNANEMAGLIAGSLHHVSDYNLRRLKTELRLYDMHTKRWRQGK